MRRYTGISWLPDTWSEATNVLETFFFLGGGMRFSAQGMLIVGMHPIFQELVNSHLSSCSQVSRQPGWGLTAVWFLVLEHNQHVWPDALVTMEAVSNVSGRLCKASVWHHYNKRQSFGDKNSLFSFKFWLAGSVSPRGVEFLSQAESGRALMNEQPSQEARATSVFLRSWNENGNERWGWTL